MSQDRAGGYESLRPRQGWLVVVLTAIVVLPIVVAIVRMMFGPKYFPGIDIAATELRVRDALHDVVLVGPYSRYGWDHPGPFLFYLLAVPYWISGEASISLPITAGIVNALSVVGCVHIGWRRLGMRGALGVLVPVALLVRAFGPEQIRDPWNVYISILPLLFCVLTLWSVAEGDWWFLVPAAVVGSFVVQSHIGYVVIISVTSVVGVGLGFGRHWRTERPRRTLRWVMLSTATALAFVWWPVVYGRLVSDDGNVSRIAQFFRAEHATAGYAKALRILGLQWGPQPEWLLGVRSTRGNFFPSEPHWYVAILIVSAAVGSWVAWRRRDRAVTTLGVIVATAVVAAVVSVAQVIGPLWPYITRWTWVVGGLLGMMTLLGLVGPMHRRRARLLVGLASGVVIVAAGAATIGAIRADAPGAARSEIEQAVGTQVLRRLPRGTGAVVIDRNESTFAVPGLVLRLERAGIDTVVSPELPIVYGEHRSRVPENVRARLVVIDGSVPPPIGVPRIASYRRQDAHGRVTEHVDVYLMPMTPVGAP